MTQLVWFRTDLRVRDNTALTAACAAGPALAIYLLTPGQWQEHDDSPAKVDFWHRNLKTLTEALKTLNIPLLIRQVPRWTDAAPVLVKTCQEYGIHTVHANTEYGINEQRRDEAVNQALSGYYVDFQRHLDQLFFEPGSVLTKKGGYFKVFGQFRKTCLTLLQHSLPPLHLPPRPQALRNIESDAVPDQITTYPAVSRLIQQHWPAGENEAHARLSRFVDERMEVYHHDRNFPARPGTSELSAYLAAGVLSPRQCLHAVLSANQGELTTGAPGASSWIDELLWREFYKHILVGYPHVSMSRAFHRHTEALPWRRDENDLRAWKHGKTGIPIIDAAMRQMLETGWMHNRLRMIAAMFLTKNLLIDWREGERWFMQNLIDGDLAANNGGWQWSASTGTDSVPYFRIFNTYSQSERFDPKGQFIRTWVPELAMLDSKAIHNPFKKGQRAIKDYPAPIVEVTESRERALAAFRNLPKPDKGQA
ncbi:deoxyribodipyrimidine photo-lyase [Pseudomonas asuensis]|uniref:Deoxyribodipyrimidine photo-lyase n=1 Tax=Pseudomonas asuensis TaxID=1825787 RepID=A0ABQ2GVK2_9PSED|nr:deoxyribodipyrimidine photo-lyase [Pseudomonas asuensis]GGM12974.1 deoxyribodipyrimidine photo-lyase [Pseudomonas asuensis]